MLREKELQLTNKMEKAAMIARNKRKQKTFK